MERIMLLLTTLSSLPRRGARALSLPLSSSQSSSLFFCLLLVVFLCFSGQGEAYQGELYQGGLYQGEPYQGELYTGKAQSDEAHQEKTRQRNVRLGNVRQGQSQSQAQYGLQHEAQCGVQFEARQSDYGQAHNQAGQAFCLAEKSGPQTDFQRDSRPDFQTGYQAVSQADSQVGQAVPRAGQVGYGAQASYQEQVPRRGHALNRAGSPNGLEARPGVQSRLVAEKSRTPRAEVIGHGYSSSKEKGRDSAGMAYGAADQVPWRIRFVEAAVIEGDLVTLGEVAVPAGDIPRQEWEKLASRTLWPAPPDNGRAVNMTRPKLQEAVMATMRDLAPYCLFPSSLALQRGGAVMHEPAIQTLVVKELTPLVAGIEAETRLKDFRLPSYIFLEHPGQIVGIEPQKKIAPGRVNFRIIVKEVDGSVAQRIAGSAFMDAWKEVPSATVALNKNDVLEASQVGRTRVNLAHLRGTPWDGRGGPWRMVRAVGVEQVIYQNDLAHIPTVTRGTVLNLVYESKTVRLQVQAEALSDGVVGENIRVKNLQSKKEVYGVVHDASTVVIRGNFQ